MAPTLIIDAAGYTGMSDDAAPYRCDACGREFEDHAHLIRHVRRVGIVE